MTPALSVPSFQMLIPDRRKASLRPSLSAAERGRPRVPCPSRPFTRSPTTRRGPDALDADLPEAERVLAQTREAGLDAFKGHLVSGAASRRWTTVVQRTAAAGTASIAPAIPATTAPAVT